MGLFFVTKANYKGEINMTIILRAYQEELLDRIRQATRKYKGICVVLPCGGGKTVIFADIARTAAIKRKRVLV